MRGVLWEALSVALQALMAAWEQGPWVWVAAPAALLSLLPRL